MLQFVSQSHEEIAEIGLVITVALYKISHVTVEHVMSKKDKEIFSYFFLERDSKYEDGFFCVFVFLVFQVIFCLTFYNNLC